MAMLACLVALAWLPQAGSPPLRASCEPGEFPYSGICCKLCPAGTHVEEYCISPHEAGKCKSCTDGESYTDFDNGLQQCFLCGECKPGYKTILPCTVKNNIVCQCNDGYYCPQGMCEECIKCKMRCPEGQVIVESCNATADMKCGQPYTESSPSSFMWLYILLGLFTSVLLFLVWIIYKWRKHNSVMKKEKEKSTDFLIPDNSGNVQSAAEAAASQDRLPETSQGDNLEMGAREQDSFLSDGPSVSSSPEAACSNEQSNGRNDVPRSNNPEVRIKDAPLEALDDAYFQLKDILGPNYWRPLMRKCGFLDNDIENIILDNPQHSDEQHYQMLRTLRDRNGVVNAFYKIFASLKEMNLNGIYENVINELKSKDLVIMEGED